MDQASAARKTIREVVDAVDSSLDDYPVSQGYVLQVLAVATATSLLLLLTATGLGWM